MKRTDNFQKFVKQKKGSAIKEEIKQAKKKAKKERAEAIEQFYAKKREARALQNSGEIARDKFSNNKESRGNKSTPYKAAKSAKVNKYPPAKSVSAGETTPVENRTRKDQNVKRAPVKKKHTSKSEQIQTRLSEHGKKGEVSSQKPPIKKTSDSKNERTVQHLSDTAAKDQMPLNKYIAHSGICSRRDAAILVKDNKVTVNGELVSDPGTKVSTHDVIKVQGKKITPSRNFVYILLNKPKDYITTLDDPQGRRTVLDLVKQATSERVYPVGRLDRNTSGVLLLTNDGDLAQKLSHPSHEIKKVYEVKLDRNLTKADLDTIANGITLEDGFVAPDVIAFADAKDKSIIGVEIHSGRNRIVRRIFEHMKYDVRGLDRVMYAGLTKKNVQRGKWRFLAEKEVRLLKFMNQSFVKVRKD
jgi:23S rRNA pseudouridine2605 synthase